MKQNITLSLDREVIKKGKILAAKRDTSISRMLSDLLIELVEREDQYAASKQAALELLESGFHLGGARTWSREALYDRTHLR